MGLIRMLKHSFEFDTIFLLIRMDLDTLAMKPNLLFEKFSSHYSRIQKQRNNVQRFHDSEK